jgi:hypothetical protein
MPEPFVCSHKAFHIPPPGAVRRKRPTCQHHLQDMEKLFCDLEVALIARVMKSDQDLIGQTPRIARYDKSAGFPSAFLLDLTHVGTCYRHIRFYCAHSRYPRFSVRG